ncbi:UNVERIFIED_CONTAM: DNA-binding GntR family transcriptional regulator [Jeotgalibacillus campisalis]
MSLTARLDRLPLRRPHYALLLIGGLGYTFDGMDNAVAAFLLPDVKAAFGVREILELRAAELVVARPAPQRRKVADKLLAMAGTLSDAAESDDWSRVQRLDLELHTALIAALGHSRLHRAYRTLATESLICMTNLKHAYPTPNSVSHHTVMAELIATGTMSEIRQAFHRHLSL